VVDRRKTRLGDESKGHQVPPSGPEVFRPAGRPHALLPLIREDGTRYLAAVRWPPQTARAQTGEEKIIPREIIHLPHPKSSRPLPDDPYLAAEARAAARGSKNDPKGPDHRSD
jgi:hypothetical protein